MAEHGRLYVTPDEFFGREQNNGRHPHGGEGNCGGSEGHGTPELNRQSAQARQSNTRNGGRQDPARNRNAKNKQSKPTEKAKKLPETAKKEQKPQESVQVSGDGESLLTRENAVLGMKMAVILSEPLCRRYGMPAYVRNKRF